MFLRGNERENEGEKHQCVAACHMLPTRDLARNQGMCPDWESNWQPFDSQAGTQPLSHTSQGKILFLLTDQLSAPSLMHLPYRSHASKK